MLFDVWCWLFVVCWGWLLSVGCCLLFVVLMVVRGLVFDVSLIVDCPVLLVVCCWLCGCLVLVAVRCWLCVVRCVLFVVCSLCAVMG